MTGGPGRLRHHRGPRLPRPCFGWLVVVLQGGHNRQERQVKVLEDCV